VTAEIQVVEVPGPLTSALHTPEGMDEVQHPNHLDFSEATKEVAFFHKDSAALRDLSAVLSAGQSLVPFSPDHSSAGRLKKPSIPTG
jgi:hypothetical protein